MDLPCPHCRIALRLLIQSLPAQATCPSCRVMFTILPQQPASPSPSGWLKRLALVLVVLAAPLAGAAALVGFGSDPLARPPERPTPSPSVQPAFAPPSGDPAREQQQRRIKEAVERGVAYLRTSLQADIPHTLYEWYTGDDLGPPALAALTLLECGVSSKDPVIVAVANRLRRDGRRLARTYGLSLSILFLDRLGDPADKTLIRDLAMHLVAGQRTSGGWYYDCPVLAAEAREELLASLWGAGPVPQAAVPQIGQETNSNTQFAILALWAARKHKIPVEQALRHAEARFRGQQNPDGSWAYSSYSHRWRHSTTCAGLLALGMGRGLESKGSAGRRQDPAIDRGLRYLGSALRALRQQGGVSQSQGLPADPLQWQGRVVGADARGDLYFLWSVERVAVLYNLKTLGEIDWYAWGSELLLANQKPDGSWRENIPGVPDTCFALLFLRRANLIKDLTDHLHGSLGLAADLGTRGYPSDRKGR
jgi:hypothetical protein